MGFLRAAAISPGAVAHTVPANSVLKVINGDEVLRVRITQPSKLAEVRRLVEAALNASGNSREPSPSSWSPSLQYIGEDGKLLELTNATFQDFVNSNNAVAKTFRVHVHGTRPGASLEDSAKTEAASADCPAGSSSTFGSQVASFLTTTNALLPNNKLLSPLRQIKRKAGEAVETITSCGERASGGFAGLEEAIQASADYQKAIEVSSAESRARLAKVLDLYKAKIRPVAADGNCQFRALSAQLCGDEEHHATLRARVAAQLRERRERYENFVHESYDQYVDRMSRNGEWGDNVTLQAASDVLGCEIRVLTDQPGSECLELSPEDAPCSTDSAAVQDVENPVPEADSACARGEANRSLPRQKPLCLTFVTEVHYDAFEIDGE
mmetsp:Transcript_123212/g.218252  ORF Transcript_123212/g.218252 Transcript_123212/m.218252 type:complete len:382 (+) Transcript_123212:56-1201(+)